MILSWNKEPKCFSSKVKGKILLLNLVLVSLTLINFFGNYIWDNRPIFILSSTLSSLRDITIKSGLPTLYNDIILSNRSM